MRSDPILYSLKKRPLPRSIMIDRLIDTAATIVDSIWLKNQNSIMSTASFIREILQRSRVSFSVLQLALFYLIRIKTTSTIAVTVSSYCGRRMFLASLMAASKYLNDKNYRNKTWARIACLPVNEVNKTEYIFLDIIQYQLYVSKSLYDKWVYLLHQHIEKQQEDSHNNTSTILPPLSQHQYTSTHTTLPWIYPDNDTLSSSSSCHSSPDVLSTPSNTPPVLLQSNRKRHLASDEYSVLTTTNKHIRII